MQYIVLVPFFASLYVAFARSAQAAFLEIYLPALLLLPNYFRAPIPCLHTFEQAAIFGLAMAFRPRLKFSIMDLLVGALWVSEFASEFQRSIFNDAISLGIDKLSEMVLPYLLAKYLIEQNGLRIAAARRFAILLFVVAIVSPVEFVSGRNPFHNLFYRFFEQGGWYDQNRWGFWRIGGPYGGSELTGCIFLAAIILQIWLFTTDKLPKREPWNPLPVHPGIVVLLGLAGGSFMTISRGPWMGLLFAIPITLVGLTKNVLRSAIVVASLSAIIGTGLYYVIDNYTNTTWQTVEDKDQQNAYYRRQLLVVYQGLAEDGGLWGWGRANRPRTGGLDSIDNEFLLSELQYGKIGSGLFIVITGWSSLSLAGAALANRKERRSDMQFQFALLGIIVGIAVSITTVYMGLQVEPVYYLAIGWAEGTKVFRSKQTGGPPDTMKLSHSGFALGHVLK
jgi:hypothetical protein